MSKNELRNKIFILIALFLLIIAGSGLWFYFYGDRNNIDEVTQSILSLNRKKSLIEDKSVISVYYPEDMKLNTHKIEIKRIFDSLELGKAAAKAFFSYYTTINNAVLSGDVEILGIYYGTDNLLYINLSRDIIRNFHGDAIDEYMFLKSLYMTVSTQIDVADIKILIDSHEASSLAGHYDLTYPIKQLFANDNEK